MKRAEIQAAIDAGVTEFMVARYNRQKGIDCDAAYPVVIKSAAQAKRRIYSTWGSREEGGKGSGVETFRAEDGHVGEKKGHRSVVQPQDVIGTRVEWEARRENDRVLRERRQNAEQVERDAAQKIVADLMDATGFVGADVLWHRGHAPGHRASVEITLEMAESITKLFSRLSVPAFEPDESDIAAMSDRDFR